MRGKMLQDNQCIQAFVFSKNHGMVNQFPNNFDEFLIENADDVYALSEFIWCL